MSVSITEACVYVSDALSAAANPEKTVGMQAYMKTDMPFYGVQKPGRTPILRRLLREFPPGGSRSVREPRSGPMGASSS